ncbi:hypothetical protein [Hyphomicrobium sp. 99]|nr:hypothetical protein [Hyphomicrobium sp. 99]
MSDSTLTRACYRRAASGLVFVPVQGVTPEDADRAIFPGVMSQA